MGSEPRKLRSQLLTWLLTPLFLLLIIDSFVTYSVALEFSRRAYDRSLVDVARAPRGEAARAPSNLCIAIQAPVMRLNADKARQWLPALQRAASALSQIDAQAAPARGPGSKMKALS